MINDADTRLLADVSSTLETEYLPGGDNPWEGSPFAWILSTPSRRRGAIGEQLVAGWCTAKGYTVTRSPHSDADRVIHGHRVEIKLSTLWTNGGYKFQQVRDQCYDYLFCLGLSPFEAHAWLIPKPVLFEHVIGVTGQHTGAGGTDTAWIGFQADTPPDWIKSFGGSLERVHRILSQLEPGPHR